MESEEGQRQVNERPLQVRGVFNNVELCHTMRIRRRRKNLQGLFLGLIAFALISIFLLARFIPHPSKDDRMENQIFSYKSAPVESDIMHHLGRLGYNTAPNVTSSGCDVWRIGPMDYNVAKIKVAEGLRTFRRELRAYTDLVEKFEGVGDLRLGLGGPDDICKTVDLHEKGLLGIFKSRQLSWSRSGYIEPLLPPMRHPEFCFNDTFLLDPSYLVHDFGAMCRKLKKTSRIVLVDMGASLSFHESLDTESPTMYLVRLFRKFGFPIDHIYAYEITPTPPENIWDRLPVELIPSYHWINVGVNGEIGHHRNPFTHLINAFNEDDFIMVKLDIDTPKLETILSTQLLNETLGKLVDQFYFEKHVHLEELAVFWAETMEGSVKDAMIFFYELRRSGIAAHFWV